MILPIPTAPRMRDPRSRYNYKNKKGVPLSTPFSPLTFTSSASTTFVISGALHRPNDRLHRWKHDRRRWSSERCGKYLRYSRHGNRRSFRTIAAARWAASYSTADANKLRCCARSCLHQIHANSSSWAQCGSNSCRSRLDWKPPRRFHHGSPIQASAMMA